MSSYMVRCHGTGLACELRWDERLAAYVPICPVCRLPVRSGSRRRALSHAVPLGNGRMA